MNPTRLPILLAVALLATGPAVAAEIYRTTDEDGNVVFTDDPPSDDAEPVELEPLTTVPSADEGSGGNAGTETGTSPTTGEATEEPPERGISGISIAYPEQGKGIRHNGGNVPFRVALQPEGATLPRGHQVEIILDGKPRARAASTRVTVSPVDRGPHTVRARIIDNAGQTRYESESVKFYLLRVSLGNN